MAFEDWFIARARVSSKPHKKITLDDKMIFFQQLGTLVASGTPLLQAVEISAEQSQSIKLRRVLEQIASRVASGSSIHAAAANYVDVFDHYWIEVIRTGEVTGQMSMVLGELNKQIRASRETRKKISGALMYPIVLICVAVTAVTAMLWMVVPTFAKMFKDMGAELPGITQFVVDLSDGIVKYGPYVVVGLIVAVFAFRKYAKTESGRRRSPASDIGLPMIGELIVQAAMYRFASNIALLLKSGIPMMESLQTVEGVFQTSPPYRDAMARVREPRGRRPAAGRGARRNQALHDDDHQHGPRRRGIGPIGDRHGTNGALLQGKNGDHDRPRHQTARTDHHCGHGHHDRRADAVDLHADV